MTKGGAYFSTWPDTFSKYNFALYLRDVNNMTYREIGEEFGVTATRARQIVIRARERVGST